MRSIWEINNHSREYVGSLEFGDFDILRGHRTATGFLLRLPVRVRLQLSKPGEPLPLLSNLEGTICTGWNVNDSIELGESDIGIERSRSRRTATLKSNMTRKN